MKTAFDSVLGRLRPGVARILEKPLLEQDLHEEEVVTLFSLQGTELLALLMTADFLRRETVGEDVTYVVNRNINFTNVCVKRCSFCAFSRTYRSREGYLLPVEEIVRRAREAWEFGASEVCIQAGMPPELEGDFYIRLCRTLKESLPELHIHAFSPEEILFGSSRAQMSFRDYLKELKGAGIGSLPGTSAEILDDRVRNRISPGRITTSQWMEIISTAHSLEIPTTATIMYGHVETHRDCARHLLLIRDLQRRGGGFTEFVPLSFIHSESPMYHEGLVQGVRPGATGNEVLRMHAISRLVLNRDIPNLQVSWVKEGLKLAQACLSAGGNDLGGTLINESISTSAGAGHGQMVKPAELRRICREAGRVPAERNTLYKIVQRFPSPETETTDPLDLLSAADTTRFGSYGQLTQAPAYRYRDRRIEATAQQQQAGLELFP